DLALEDAPGMIVHDAFEEFAAGATGKLVIDDESRVGMLLAAQQIGARGSRIRPLAREIIGAVLAINSRAGSQGEIAERHVLAQCHMRVREVNGLRALVLELDAVEPGAIAKPDLGHT